MCCEGPFGAVTRDRRVSRRSALRAQHTGTLGEVKASRRLAEFIRRSSSLFFFIFSAVLFLLPNSVHALPQTLNT
ncbi:hypothetical protein H5410_022295 [Solanum commersonii]|uniref:Transmembrane protein n=1 Tax=Solanum commersonii TaxID=4109 RepID=A0A9J5ZJ32_SOLCO|nr:hypothetical protein H5410_022295 [Solanum commersonii]